ncbi:MAG: ABC transporter ATP-binding protein [Pseudomonadota bacterium]
MNQVLRIFFDAKGTRPVLVLLCLVLGALAQGIGLASMLPIVSIVLGTEEQGAGASTEAVFRWLDWAGIPAEAPLLLAFAVLAILLKNALTFLAMIYVGYSVAHISTSIRRRFVDRLLEVRLSYLADEPAGAITNALSVDATRAGNAYLAVANFIVQALQALIYVGVALFVSWQVTLVALGAGLGIAFLLRYFIRKARNAGRRQTQHTSDFTATLADGLNNLKPLRAMERQRHVSALLGHSVERLRKALRRQVVAKHALKNINEVLAAAIMAAGLALAVGFLEIPGTELVVLALLLVQLVSTINKAQREYQNAVILESAYYNVLDRIDAAAAAREIDSGTALPVLEQGCRFESVSFSHPDRPVLHDVTLEFPVNRTTVLTGPSGAGKTTVTDLVLGFITPSSGRILIDGRPLSEISLRAWRRTIGYVPQELVLFNETVFENIALGDPEIGESDVRAALKVAGGLAFVDALPEGLATVVGEKGARLSGGQRQRIALARALVLQPKLLILDEVTSALDPSSEAEIVENIRALKGKTTIIAITHRSALLDIADRTYALAEGRIVPNPSLRVDTADAV